MFIETFFTISKQFYYFSKANLEENGEETLALLVQYPEGARTCEASNKRA
jgi:hypothetical protein